MLTNVERGSIPLGGHASSMGVLPEEFNNRDVPVSYTDGSVGNACHIAANGQFFSLKQLVGGVNRFNAIVIDEVSYVDTDGDVKIFEVPEAEPTKYLNGKEFTLGYVTKLNNLRWGFNFHYDPVTGRGQIVKDPGSPIIGVCFHLTNI